MVEKIEKDINIFAPEKKKGGKKGQQSSSTRYYR